MSVSDAGGEGSALSMLRTRKSTSTRLMQQVMLSTQTNLRLQRKCLSHHSGGHSAAHRSFLEASSVAAVQASAAVRRTAALLASRLNLLKAALDEAFRVVSIARPMSLNSLLTRISCSISSACETAAAEVALSSAW